MLCTRTRAASQEVEEVAGMAPRKDDLFWNAIMNVKIKKPLFRRRIKLDRTYLSELAHKFHISESDVKKVHSIFVAMDEDNSGSISSNEVATMLMGWGCDVVQAVMRTSDVNGDGEINFEEFLCAVTSKIREAPRSEGSCGSLQPLKDALSKDSITNDQKELPVCPWENAGEGSKEVCLEHKPCQELAEKHEQQMREEYRQAINSAPTSPELLMRKLTCSDEEVHPRDDSNESEQISKEMNSVTKNEESSEKDVHSEHEASQPVDSTIRSGVIFNSLEQIDLSDFVQYVQTV